MDEDLLINAIDAPGIKTSYESNADTNAFTDTLRSKLIDIEDNAKDDQNAGEVDYSNGSSGLTATNVQNAIDEIKGIVDPHIQDTTIHFTQSQISITESQVSDLQSYLLPTDIGVTVQGYDATTLKSTDIGVTVQSYNANTVIDANYETFDSSGDFENLRARATTATDVGLENVTNESKATMFTNAALTGVPIAPTAAFETNTTQIATTAFVQAALAGAQTIDGGEF
jgi:hypothetical protein